MLEPERKTAINIFFFPPDLTALFATKDFRRAIIPHEKKRKYVSNTNWKTVILWHECSPEAKYLILGIHDEG